MKLVVRVIEAKNLATSDSNGLSDLYVRVQLGKQKFKTKVVKSLNPTWDEQFAFWVDDLKDSLVISVMDEDKFFNYDYVGRLKVPISLVFEEEIKSLGTAWYSLKSKNKKYKNKQCGILYFSTELSSTLSNCFGHFIYLFIFTSPSPSQFVRLFILLCEMHAVVILLSC